MNIKKTLALSLSLIMTVSAFSGCLNKSDTDSSKAENSSQSSSEQNDENGEKSDEKNSDSNSDSNATTDTTEREPDGEVAVEFSDKSGIYSEEFELSLSATEEGDIYYTLDGSDPRTSETAIKYESAVKISDRNGEANVVSAVSPSLISGNFNQVAGNGFICTMNAPEDDAVDKCTVVRAAVRKSDGTNSGVSTATYFIGTMEEHIQGLSESCKASGKDLAVISISMEYDDLFDSQTGIYVKGDIFDKALEDYVNAGEWVENETARRIDANYKQKGRAWEKDASISMFECGENSAVEVISQSCGIRVQGNYSRSDLQKGFRLYARSDYGNKNFKYAVFGEDYLNDAGEVMDKYKTLVLRAGGNCAFTAKFNDTYWQSLVEDTKCETKKSRPCVVYLNGEYWGLYVLEEDYSDDYFEDLHGVNKDDVVVYKGDAEALSLGYKLDEGELPEGETDESYYFNDLLDFFKTHKSLKDDGDYQEFIKLVDPESVRDYFAVECWINNKWDWPGKNWSMWRTATSDGTEGYGDGRWRFMFYDVEFGGVSGEGDAYTNTIKEDNYKENGLLDMGTNNPAVLCFAYLMTNEGFRNDFYDKLNSLSETNFEKTAALKRIEEFENIYSPLYDQFFERYPGTGSKDEALYGGYASSQCIRDFLEKRADNIEKMIKYCDRILTK